jgi:hypothetical protein
MVKVKRHSLRPGWSLVALRPCGSSAMAAGRVEPTGATVLAGKGAVDGRTFYAGSLSNRGNSSSVGAAGGSGAPRTSKPPGWLAWRSIRLSSRSNLPVFHCPYRQVQSLCKRTKVWQSIYLRSSGASRFISKLRMHQCQTDRVSQIRQSRKMGLSPYGFYGMILFAGRAVYNRRLENISARRFAVRLTAQEADSTSRATRAERGLRITALTLSGRATHKIQRDGRTERGGPQYFLFNGIKANLMAIEESYDV